MKTEFDRIWDSINEIVTNDHLARACVDLYKYTGESKCECVARLALALLQVKQEILKELLDIKRRGLPPYIIVTSQEQADKILEEYNAK